MFGGHAHSFMPSTVAGFGDFHDMAYDIVPAQDLSGFGDLEIAEEMAGLGELEIAVDGFGDYDDDDDDEGFSGPRAIRRRGRRRRRILMRRYRRLKGRRKKLLRRLKKAKGAKRRARIAKRLTRVKKMMLAIKRRLSGKGRLRRKRRMKRVRRFRPRQYAPIPMPTGTPPMALYRPQQQPYIQAPLPLQNYAPITQPQPSYQTIGQNQQSFINMNADAGEGGEEIDDESYTDDEYDEDSEENNEMEGFGMYDFDGYGAMQKSGYLPAAAVAGAVYFVTAPSARTKKAATAALITSLGIGALFFMATSKRKTATAGW